MTFVKEPVEVVNLRYLTSNHNIKLHIVIVPGVVNLRYPTSNHNIRYSPSELGLVVNLRYPTSNHNHPGLEEMIQML